MEIILENGRQLDLPRSELQISPILVFGLVARHSKMFPSNGLTISRAIQLQCITFTAAQLETTSDLSDDFLLGSTLLLNCLAEDKKQRPLESHILRAIFDIFLKTTEILRPPKDEGNCSHSRFLILLKIDAAAPQRPKCWSIMRAW